MSDKKKFYFFKAIQKKIIYLISNCNDKLSTEYLLIYTAL